MDWYDTIVYIHLENYYFCISRFWSTHLGWLNFKKKKPYKVPLYRDGKCIKDVPGVLKVLLVFSGPHYIWEICVKQSLEPFIRLEFAVWGFIA